MYGKGLVSDGSLNHHKQMAQGKVDGGAMAGSVSGGKNNQKAVTSGELSDGGRGIASHGSANGQQRAPDHGDVGGDHFRRGGLL